MHFPNQSIGEGEVFLQALQSMLQGSHIIGNFHHVVQGSPRRFLQLEEQKVGNGGLGAFDLEGEKRLPLFFR